MKIIEIKKLMDGWSVVEKAQAFSAFSGNFKNSYYQGKNKGYWIELNLEYIKKNLEVDIDLKDSTNEYKNMNLLISLLAFTKPNTLNHDLLLKTIKEQKLEQQVLATIKYATNIDISNAARSNYYIIFRDCLKNGFYDLNSKEIQQKFLNFYKKATTINNKKYYSEALFSIAEYFYENRKNLDHIFVLEIVEDFLVTGKYIKSNLEKIMEMSNWREEQLSFSGDTIEASCIIKKINPIKISKITNQEKSTVDIKIEKLHSYLNKKIYTQEQYISISLIDQAADKVFIIAFEKKTKEIETASEFITYISNNKINEADYNEVWDKMILKNKINESIPAKDKFKEKKIKI